jgi:hypothetical protein
LNVNIQTKHEFLVIISFSQFAVLRYSKFLPTYQNNADEDVFSDAMWDRACYYLQEWDNEWADLTTDHDEKDERNPIVTFRDGNLVKNARYLYRVYANNGLQIGCGSKYNTGCDSVRDSALPTMSNEVMVVAGGLSYQPTLRIIPSSQYVIKVGWERGLRPGFLPILYLNIYVDTILEAQVKNPVGKFFSYTYQNCTVGKFYDVYATAVTAAGELPQEHHTRRKISKVSDYCARVPSQMKPPIVRDSYCDPLWTNPNMGQNNYVMVTWEMPEETGGQPIKGDLKLIQPMTVLSL